MAMVWDSRHLQVNASEMASGRFYDTDLVLISHERFDENNYDDAGNLVDQASRENYYYYHHHYYYYYYYYYY